MRTVLGKAAPLALAVWLVGAARAHADTAAPYTAGDTAFMLICAALVLFMTPGLAFFYGGMVRRKNVLATLMQSFVAMAVVSVTWVVWGYSNAFAPSILHGFMGGFQWAGLKGVLEDQV